MKNILYFLVGIISLPLCGVIFVFCYITSWGKSIVGKWNESFNPKKEEYL